MILVFSRSSIHRILRGARAACAAISILACALPAAALDVLVPAYGNPCCEGGPAMWSGLIAAASTPGRPYALLVVFNPANGPGVTTDPNYVDANGQGPLPSLRAAGAIVFGYVATGFGSRPATEVLADIDTYLIGHYAGLVDGIFFDELSTDLARVGDGLAYAARVEQRSPGAPTIGNPGTTGVVNPSGQTLYSAADYAAVFDVLVTAENSGAAYRTSYAPPPYLSEKPASGFAHIVHSESPFDPALLTLVAARGAGIVFVTDDVLPNPYDRLPSEWPAFLAAVSAGPPAAAPLSSPFGLGLFGASLLIFGCACSRERSSGRQR